MYRIGNIIFKGRSFEKKGSCIIMKINVLLNLFFFLFSVLVFNVNREIVGTLVVVKTMTLNSISCIHSYFNLFQGRPAEKPICLCLSNLDQLADVNPPFSPLLWNFMRRCYPGGISCVVPKGEWLKVRYLALGQFCVWML